MSREVSQFLRRSPAARAALSPSEPAQQALAVAWIEAWRAGRVTSHPIRAIVRGVRMRNPDWKTDG